MNSLELKQIFILFLVSGKDKLPFYNLTRKSFGLIIMNGRVFFIFFRKIHLFIDKDECEDDEQMWVSPINVVIKSDKKQFSLDFIVNGIEDISKTLFWIENINIYIK